MAGWHVDNENWGSLVRGEAADDDVQREKFPGAPRGQKQHLSSSTCTCRLEPAAKPAGRGAGKDETTRERFGETPKVGRMDGRHSEAQEVEWKQDRPKIMQEKKLGR